MKYIDIHTPVLFATEREQRK